MNTPIPLLPLKQQFAFLLSLMQSGRFLKMQGLGNELPFYICPFKPSDAVEVEEHIRALVTSLRHASVQALHINLYDLCLSILSERDILEQLIEVEPQTPKADLLEPLQGVLDPGEYLVPAIAARMETEPHDVLLLSGVGEIYPYLRSHSILNNLQSTVTDHPLVLFFPGEYTRSAETGSTLDLFNILHDDKYYRAFNIFHCGLATDNKTE